MLADIAEQLQYQDRLMFLNMKQKYREKLTYWLEIPERNYLTIVELEKQEVIRAELKEELRQRLMGWVGLVRHQDRLKVWSYFKSQWLWEDK